MVEKIDRPEPKTVYYVDSSAKAGDDRGKKEQQQPEGDEYSGSHAAPGWQKVYASSANRRYVKLRRENIARAWFNGTTMQRGIALADIHIETRDGRILKNAHIVLALREDFWTLKKFQIGQEIPVNLIIKEPIVEISVPQLIEKPAENIAMNVKAENKKKKEELINMIVYAAIGLIVLGLLIFIIRG